MPVVPAYNQTVYDQVGYALNDARIHLGARLDTLEFISGKIRDFTDPFMQQLTNNGYRSLQSCLANLGYQQLTSEVIIQKIPVVANPDPAVFCWLGWAGFFDGVQLWDQPALPQDFTHPLKVWERWSNTNAQFTDPPMEKMLDGMPTRVKTPYNAIWEWRQDTIWIPGSQNVEDLRIRYTRFLPDFIDVSTYRWFQQPVAIMRGSEALGWFIAAAVENAASNGDKTIAAQYADEGKAAAQQIFNRDVRADIRVNIRRRPRSAYMGDRGSSW